MDQFHMLIVLVQDILVINLPTLCKRIITVNPEVLGVQCMVQFMLLTHCGMVKDATLVTVACCSQVGMPWFYRDVLGKINEPI